jgi:hypothetical protein
MPGQAVVKLLQKLIMLAGNDEPAFGQSEASTPYSDRRPL